MPPDPGAQVQDPRPWCQVRMLDDPGLGTAQGELASAFCHSAFQ
jgi:hypothetical protein